MIIVTGTKRSGTSMWMQLLQAAGFPPIGNAFPRNWETTIKDANPAGFYESELRQGIYFATNPHPKAGTYLFPEQTKRHAVKVFIPGLIKTDRAFIDKVVATVRPWRQYVTSLRRLYAMERQANKEAREKAAATDQHEPIPRQKTLPPELEWWGENFSLISDIVTRRYPFTMVAYENVVHTPEQTLPQIFEWLGEGNVQAAVAQVDPTLRTQTSDSPTSDDDLARECDLSPQIVDAFDSYYRAVKESRQVTQALVDTMNEVHAQLTPRIEAAVREVVVAEKERQALIKQRRKSDQSPTA